MTTTSIVGFVLLGVLLLVLAGLSTTRARSRTARSDGGYWGGMFVDGGGSCGDGGAGGGGDCGGA